MTALLYGIRIYNCRFWIILQIIKFMEKLWSSDFISTKICILYLNIKMFKENSMIFACFLLNQYMVMCMGHYKYTNILLSCMRAWIHTAFKVLSSTKCSKVFFMLRSWFSILLMEIWKDSQGYQEVKSILQLSCIAFYLMSQLEIQKL